MVQISKRRDLRICAFLAGLSAAQMLLAADGLQAEISGKGVAKLVWQGVDLLAAGAPKVNKAVYDEIYEAGAIAPPGIAAPAKRK